MLSLGRQLFLRWRGLEDAGGSTRRIRTLSTRLAPQLYSNILHSFYLRKQEGFRCVEDRFLSD